MTSVEKVRAMLDALHGSTPANEEEARELALLGTILPVALGYLPEEPDGLDEMLAKGARFCILLRSDDAEPVDVGGELPGGLDELPELAEFGVEE